MAPRTGGENAGSISSDYDVCADSGAFASSNQAAAIGSLVTIVLSIIILFITGILWGLVWKKKACQKGVIVTAGPRYRLPYIFLLM